jgi:hypothetical protein
VIHHLDHRGPRVGCNLNQVQPRFIRPFSSFLDADDTDLLTIIGNEANGADPDLVVDSDLLFFDGSEPPLVVSFRFQSGLEQGQTRKARLDRAHAASEKPHGPPILA